MQNDPNGTALAATILGLFLFLGVPILITIYEEIKSVYFRRIEAHKPVIYNIIQKPEQAIIVSPRGTGKKDRQRSHVRTVDNIHLLYKQQKGKCWWCGTDLLGIYHVDHRMPFSKGGTDDLGNLCLACPSCNEKKSDKLPHEFNGRLL